MVALQVNKDALEETEKQPNFVSEMIAAKSIELDQIDDAGIIEVRGIIRNLASISDPLISNLRPPSEFTAFVSEFIIHNIDRHVGTKLLDYFLKEFFERTGKHSSYAFLFRYLFVSYSRTYSPTVKSALAYLYYKLVDNVAHFESKVRLNNTNLNVDILLLCDLKYDLETGELANPDTEKVLSYLDFLAKEIQDIQDLSTTQENPFVAQNRENIADWISSILIDKEIPLTVAYIKFEDFLIHAGNVIANFTWLCREYEMLTSTAYISDEATDQVIFVMNLIIDCANQIRLSFPRFYSNMSECIKNLLNLRLRYAPGVREAAIKVSGRLNAENPQLLESLLISSEAGAFWREAFYSYSNSSEL